METEVGKHTKEILTKLPRSSDRQLAKILFEKFPLVYKSEDQARTNVRYYRGNQGNANRTRITDKSFIREDGIGEQLRQNPFGLPKDINDDWKSVKFPIKTGKGLLLPDIHLPYHDIEAITCALKWGKENGYTDFILFQGDLLDYQNMSKFNRDPYLRKYTQDLDDVGKLFDAIQGEFPKAQLIYKLGNHDYRLYDYIRMKAPELFSLADWMWKEYLKINERGIIVVNHDVPMVVGKLGILHGHELGLTYNLVSPARGAFLKALECVIVAHNHQTSTHSSVTMFERLITTWSVGALCNLHPQYARYNKWNHGFAGLEVDGKDFEIRNMRIFQGMVR